MKRRTLVLAAFVAAFLVVSLLLGACGGGNSSTPATVNLSMSDPPTCSSAAQGAYSHVYVTVSDVRISTNPNAADNDSSWVDLTPNLATAPRQVDLLGTPTSGCLLAQLGSAGIPAGTYQQIRLKLATGNVTPANGNQCGNGSLNCVVLNNSNPGPYPLQLSSEAQTGLKIPSGQIAGGQFTIAAGQTKDLNIDLDACASIVVSGNGGFRLKPVLHAGEVTAVSAVTGRLVDQSGAPITSGIVALEQVVGGVDRAILQTTPDQNGNFSLCPVANGTYDLVAVGIRTTNNVDTAYGPTLIAGVTPGATLGNITVNVTPGSASPATLRGTPLVSAQGASPATGIAEDFVVSALQQVTIGSASTATTVTIPLAEQQSATLTLTTASSGDCAPNTWCADAALVVPAANIAVGTFSGGTISYAPVATTPVTYTIDAQAPATTTQFCSQTVKTTNPITVTPGADITFTPANPTLAFTGCQ